MQAMITGAAGFVGPHLTEHLLSEGDDVVGVDLDNGPDLLDPSGWQQLLREHRPEVLYHLAGWSDVGASWQSPVMAWRVNTEGVIAVLDAARAVDVARVVVVSSADIYGTIEPAQLPITEQTPLRPRSPYGASKEGAEALARQFHRGWGVDVVIARPFNHIGPGQSTNFVAASFADHIAKAERRGGGELRHGDLSPRRDFTDVRDVVRAYRKLATDGHVGQTYNICSGVDVSMQELLDNLLSMANVAVELVEDPALRRPVDLPVLRGSHELLTADTGWIQQFSLEQTLRDILDDARNRQHSLPGAST